MNRRDEERIDAPHRRDAEAEEGQDAGWPNWIAQREGARLGITTDAEKAARELLNQYHHGASPGNDAQRGSTRPAGEGPTQTQNQNKTCKNS